jgi:TolB-like protein/Tfp pilus assembly protein PilF
MNGFLEELKRRKVYRVAIAYIVAGWALAQGLAQVLPVFDVPNSIIRVVIALMLIGFPVALVLAWMFDVTPEGIKATPSSTPAFQRRNVLLLVGIGVIVSAATGFFLLLPGASARKIDKSIAVLPFENLSDDKENAYFADGIQDDILTNLSKIGDLRVISRTSVMGYRDKAPNVREIAKALGVSNILEGTVRRYGNKVRVGVQLIDATSDKHIWAEDYDGDLTDVFKIQTDLAHQIADALQAKLSPSEKAHLEHKSTENNEAYLAFQRAHELQCAYEDFGKLKESEQNYERAITLDPSFAVAYARYAQLEAWIVHTFESSAASKSKARTLARRALQLQPDLPEAHLAQGFVNYYVDNDFDAAAREFEIAHQGLPNDAESYLALGAIQRRQDKWAESNASLEKAVSLNPKDVWTIQNLAINYEMERDWAAANKTIDMALAVDPNSLPALELKAKFAVEEKGDFGVAQDVLAKIDQLPFDPAMKAKIAGDAVTAAALQRKFDEAIRIAEAIPDQRISSYPGALCSKYLTLGQLTKRQGDEAKAREYLARARKDAEQDVRENPDSGDAHARLALTMAWQGERDAALAEMNRAGELLPVTKDAFSGPDIMETAAEMHALFGDAAGAVSILDQILQRPSSVTVATLKLNPVWDPIRKDPKFQALIEKYGAKA